MLKVLQIDLSINVINVTSTIDIYTVVGHFYTTINFLK